MNHNQFAMDFYLKQEKKRKDSMKANDIFRINNTLNQEFLRTFHQFKNHIQNVDEVKKEITRYGNRHGIIQSTLFNLKYRNNFENIEVAVLQYVLIEWMCKKMDKSTRGIEYLKHQILNIDYAASHTLRKHLFNLDKIELDFI